MQSNDADDKALRIFFCMRDCCIYFIILLELKPVKLVQLVKNMSRRILETKSNPTETIILN